MLLSPSVCMPICCASTVPTGFASQYHLPFVKPIVALAPSFIESPSLTLVAPSLITGCEAYTHKGFQVQKLRVGVSVAWSPAVMFD
jgi:hypothetical protein